MGSLSTRLRPPVPPSTSRNTVLRLEQTVVMEVGQTNLLKSLICFTTSSRVSALRTAEDRIATATYQNWGKRSQITLTHAPSEPGTVPP